MTDGVVSSGLEGEVARIVAALTVARVTLSDEKRTQADLAEVLTVAGIPFEREVRLSARDIPDFVAFGRIVVEVKLKGARKIAVWTQLMRYAAHDNVAAIVLVTNLSMGLAPAIAGKPSYYVSLGRSWL